MANPSSPLLPSSFDPAVHLHGEIGSDIPNIIPLSESHSSELEAIHLQHQETIRDKTRRGIVIQHRAWNLSDLFRSDDDIRPDTPTKRQPLLKERDIAEGPSSDTIIPSSPPRPSKMPLISSPVMYPLSSSPAPRISHQKRKLDGLSTPMEPKRPRMIGGFLADEDEDEDDDIDNLEDVQLPNYFPPENSIGNSHFSMDDASGLDEFIDRFPKSYDFGDDTQSNLRSPTLPTPIGNHQTTQGNDTLPIRSCSGKVYNVKRKNVAAPIPYEKLIADRSTTAAGKAKRSYYGINIHQLLDETAKEAEEAEVLRRNKVLVPELPIQSVETKKTTNPMWAEKYRARKFTDLIGDERTHRTVLRWLKGWDPIVFPGLARSKKKASGNDNEERVHRKILLLAGPPGLGKTTLAHVCAKQAGYEALEINASDERSSNVVKNRIKDVVGTENVRGISVGTGDKKVRKAGKPVCVIVDEVDGVTSGAGGGGEGGFMKALIDLLLLDQRNSDHPSNEFPSSGRKSRKRDKFRMLRPLILICNDVYHPSLRPLRASSFAEIVHVRQAPLEKVIQRMKGVFEKEGIQCDLDGVRKLCESSWGMGGGRESRTSNRGAGEGDIRGVLVAGEWIAHKFRSTCLATGNTRLTKRWIEQHVLKDAIEGSSSSRGLGRGGVKAIVDRVFLEGAGLPNTPVGANSLQNISGSGATTSTIGVAELRRSKASNWLREMVDTSGEYDRCITDCFAKYPTLAFQDDTSLSKPNAAYEWLHFHDLISSKVFSNQDWELNPYLSQSVVAFHHLFASASIHAWDVEQNKFGNDEEEDEHPFSGPRADFAAFEAERQNRAVLLGFQSSFSAPLIRTFHSTESVSTDLIPNLIRMLSPDVKPVVVGGSGDQKGVASVRKESERNLVKSAVNVMSGMGVTFEKTRVEIETGTHSGWVYRMEPPLDTLTTFSKTKGSTLSSTGSSIPVRFAVRQVLDQEYHKELLRRQAEAQQARYSKARTTLPGATPVTQTVHGQDENADAVKAPRAIAGKRDFFGRIINEARPSSSGGGEKHTGTTNENSNRQDMKAWVSFHEGFSNAVRKPISLNELMSGL